MSEKHKVRDMALPDADLWQSWGVMGEDAVRAPLTKLSLQMLAEHPAAPIAIGFGALSAICQMIEVVCAPEGRRQMEEMVVAYVRGNLRGLEGPVHEDGRAWEGTHYA